MFTRSFSSLLLSFSFSTALATVSWANSHPAELLPRENIVLKSALNVDLATHSVTLPIHRATFNGETYWYILTDVSDEALANELGLNFAPKLANAGRGCPSCVQVLNVPRRLTDASMIRLAGAVDFSPRRILHGSMTGFPPVIAEPGSKGTPLYSPYIQVKGTNIVYNASIIAKGTSRFDVTTHTNTHDRVLEIDTMACTAKLLVIRAFSGGQEVVYLGLDSSSPEAATLERSTFAPGLALLSFPNGAFRTDGARAGLFSFINGQTGANSPPAQGLNHLIIDGHATEDASLGNHALIDALRAGGDARNIIEVFPTMTDPVFRLEYSPAWDLHLTSWTTAAVNAGNNVAQTDAFTVRTLAANFVVTAPGGLALASSGIEVNCPVVAFVKNPPLGPVVPSPVPLPLPHQD